jgi:hypothetical protein
MRIRTGGSERRSTRGGYWYSDPLCLKPTGATGEAHYAGACCTAICTALGRHGLCSDATHPCTRRASRGSRIGTKCARGHGALHERPGTVARYLRIRTGGPGLGVCGGGYWHPRRGVRGQRGASRAALFWCEPHGREAWHGLCVLDGCGEAWVGKTARRGGGRAGHGRGVRCGGEGGRVPPCAEGWPRLGACACLGAEVQGEHGESRPRSGHRASRILDWGVCCKRRTPCTPCSLVYPRTWGYNNHPTQTVTHLFPLCPLGTAEVQGEQGVGHPSGRVARRPACKKRAMRHAPVHRGRVRVAQRA